MAESKRLFLRSAQDEKQEGITRLISDDLNVIIGGIVKSQRPGQEIQLMQMAQPLAARYDALPVKNDFEKSWKTGMAQWSHNVVMSAAIQAERWTDAEKAARASLAILFETGIRNDGDRADAAYYATELALVLARQGRRDEARAALEPAQAFYAEMLPRHRENQNWIAAAARAQRAVFYSLPDDPASLSARRAAVAEAKRLLGVVSAELRAVRDQRDLLTWIAETESTLAVL